MSEHTEDISRAAVKAVLESSIDVPRTTVVIEMVAKAIATDREIAEREHQAFRLQNDREWRAKIEYLKALLSKAKQVEKDQ